VDEKANVRVMRFDPAKDKEPRYDAYGVPYKGLTVLQVLKYIFENEDPSLAFRWGCDGVGPARCGACVVEVNGAPALACQMLATPEMVLRPHQRFTVIKDLVVDFEKEGDGNA